MATLLTTLPAQAHTRAELDDWLVDWVIKADESLNPALQAEFLDMKARHPYYFNPRPQSSRTYQSWNVNAGVEQWRGLVTVYFPADQIDRALCIMWAESKGNPNADNPYSSASGLFQHLAKYWADRSVKAGWEGSSIWDPEANVAVAAWLWRTGGWGHWTVYPRCR